MVETSKTWSFLINTAALFACHHGLHSHAGWQLQQHSTQPAAAKTARFAVVRSEHQLGRRRRSDSAGQTAFGCSAHTAVAPSAIGPVGRLARRCRADLVCRFAFCHKLRRWDQFRRFPDGSRILCLQGGPPLSARVLWYPPPFLAHPIVSYGIQSHPVAPNHFLCRSTMR